MLPRLFSCDFALCIFVKLTTKGVAFLCKNYYLFTYLVTYLFTYLFTYLLIYLFNFLLTYLFTYLHI